MNADLSWGEVRWRDPQSHPRSSDLASITTPKIAHHRPYDMGFRDDQSAWRSRPYVHADHELYAPVAKTGANLHASRSLLGRTKSSTKLHDSPDLAQERFHGQQKPESSIPRTSENIWTGSASGQTDQQPDTDHRLSEHSPMLHTSIPTGLPSMLNDHNTLRGRDHADTTEARVSPQAQATSLPSFASLQRSTSCTEESTALPQNVHSPVKTSCRGCAEKDSSIEDIAIAVSGIEEILKMNQPESITKRPDGIQSKSSRTARWVLDRLQEVRLKVGLHDTHPTITAGYGYRSHQQSDQTSSGPTKSLTPPSSAKRHPDWHEVDDTHLHKRQRNSPSNDQHLELNPTLKYLEDQRRASESIQRDEPYRTFSPSHSDSWVSSARPRQQSPSVIGRSLRPLPSPSSLANTSLKTPWTGSIAPSAGSPTISHPAPSSIHTASVSSAASQHIADLQHQITVKSLGLQTLQSEYTSLLQKFQRDRLKSQTLEKKAIAADQEVNELTSKNEELMEQVKSLEAQTEQSEKKREAERAEALREKDQWGKMLEMSGRLQAKNGVERQKLAKERDELLQRVLVLENDCALPGRNTAEHIRGVSQSHEHETRRPETSGATSEETNALVLSLQKDNETLQARTVKLRTALERVEAQYIGIMNRRRELLQQEASVPAGVARALQEDNDAPGFKSDQSQFEHFNWHETGQQEAFRQSSDLSPPRQKGNANAPSDSVATKNIHLEEPSSSASGSGGPAHETPISSSSTHEPDSTTSKQTSPPRFKTVNLPKWQPPNTSALRTNSSELLSNNQRRASGPSTPFPGSETHLPQWQPTKTQTTSPPTINATSSSPPQSLPAFNSDKTPARNYNPQYVPPTSQIAGPDLEKSDASASMPPPPRPGVASSSSWRTS